MKYIKTFNEASTKSRKERKNRNSDGFYDEELGFVKYHSNDDIETKNTKDKDIIKTELKKYGIRNYTINDDGTVDVDGDVDLTYGGIAGGRIYTLPFLFGRVSGNFNCSINRLQSLHGCPYYVGGDFNCSNNLLSNLLNSPKEVVGNFDCSNNEILTIEGISFEIGGDFICKNNKKLKSLKTEIPIYIAGYIRVGDDSSVLNMNFKDFDGHCKEIIISE